MILTKMRIFQQNFTNICSWNLGKILQKLVIENLNFDKCLNFFLNFLKIYCEILLKFSEFCENGLSNFAKLIKIFAFEHQFWISNCNFPSEIEQKFGNSNYNASLFCNIILKILQTLCVSVTLFLNIHD